MNPDDPNVQLVTKVVDEELRHLIQQRADITKRIRTIKQTILGLCSLFGYDELSEDEACEPADRRLPTRRPGLTDSCRAILRSANRPLTARELSEHILQRDRNGSQSSKNLVASVAVVLDRLVQSGEALKVVRDDGRRSWLRASDVEDKPAP